jgi:hypothetical protein
MDRKSRTSIQMMFLQFFLSAKVMQKISKATLLA